VSVVKLIIAKSCISSQPGITKLLPVLPLVNDVVVVDVVVAVDFAVDFAVAVVEVIFMFDKIIINFAVSQNNIKK